MAKKVEKWACSSEMMQEKEKKDRILFQLFCRFWRNNRVNKRKKRSGLKPFRWVAIGLSVFTMTLLVRFPNKAVSLQNQQEQLAAAASAYYDAQTRHNQLVAELSEINTADFIERTARREYGYSWYGETIYEVGNLDELRQQAAFEVYGDE